MNGLVSATPSPSAVRLALGGFLLLLAQSAMLLLSPALDTSGRLLIGVFGLIALTALLLALVGPPEPPSKPWRRRHGR